MPALSIIVTSYNIESYISQCLDSIICQSLKDIEIIVVDDGSSDRTPELIAEYAQQDSRIRPVFLEDNSIGGVGTPANAGLDLATAPYVGFADGDDYCEPHMFEALLNAALQNDHDLAMCQYKLLDESTGELADPAEVNRWADISEGSYTLDAEGKKKFLKFIAVPWRKIYRRSLLEEENIRFPVGDYFYEDNPFHWFSIVAANSIAIVPEVLCYHRVARTGQTMSTVDERLFRIFIHHDTIRDWLVGRGDEEIYRPDLFAWAMSQMEWISRRTPQPLRQKLFDVLLKIYAQYDQNDIEQALVQGKKGQMARKLSDALAQNNFAKFNQYLDGRGKGNNLLIDGFYHLRYSGVRHTAGLVRRYAGQRMGGQTALKRISRQTNNPKSVKNEDLMLALVVLQAQIKRLEEKINTKASE